MESSVHLIKQSAHGIVNIFCLRCSAGSYVGIMTRWTKFVAAEIHPSIMNNEFVYLVVLRIYEYDEDADGQGLYFKGRAYRPINV